MHEFRTVAKVEELRPGRGLRVEVEGRVLALFKVGDEVRALDNLCAHRGGSLADGEVEEGVVTCPLHAWAYDTATGTCVTNPGAAVRSYPVRVEDGKVQVAV